MKLRPNVADALKITDGTDDIFQITTSGSGASQVALTVGTSGSLVLSTPKIDLSGKETAVYLKDDSTNAFTLTVDGTNSMMVVETDAGTVTNQKISFASGGRMVFATPLVDYSNQTTEMKLRPNVADALKITDGTVNIFDVDTRSMTLSLTGNSVEMRADNVTFDASSFVDLQTPLIKLSSEDTVLEIGNSDQALTVKSENNDVILQVDTNTGSHPTEINMKTKLVIDTPDVGNVGTVAYDVVKINEAKLHVGVSNGKMLTSLYVDNMELTGAQGTTLNMAATLYVDGNPIVPTDESSASISGFNISTTNYAMYIAGDTSYNQIRGKLFVKGGLYIGESNGTFTELSANALTLVEGTNSAYNNVASKSVVTDASGKVNIQTLVTTEIDVTNTFKLGSAPVTASAIDLNYLSGISTQSSYFDLSGSVASLKNKLLFVSSSYFTKTLALQIHDNPTGKDDIEITRIFANITHSYNSASSEMSISSTYGVVRVEEVRFDQRAISQVDDLELNTLDPIKFVGTTATSFVTKLNIIEPTQTNTITLPDASGTVCIQAGAGVTLSNAGSMSVDATQTQITSVGTLTSLTISGAATVQGATLTVGGTSGDFTIQRPGHASAGGESLLIKGQAAGGSSNAVGGSVGITGGTGSSTNGAGGAVTLTGGSAVGSGAGGNVILQTGTTSSGSHGNVIVKASDGSTLLTIANDGSSTHAGTAQFNSGLSISGASPIVFDGATADANKITFAITDPTSGSKTITFTAETGYVALVSTSTCTDNDYLRYSTSSNTFQCSNTRRRLDEQTDHDKEAVVASGHGTIISRGTVFATVSSVNDDHVVVLPPVEFSVGRKVELLHLSSSSGYRLKSDAGGINGRSTSVLPINVAAATSAEGGSLVTCKCLMAEIGNNYNWICTKVLLNAPEMTLSL